MLSKLSIQIKHTLIFLISLLMISIGFVFGIQDLKMSQLNNEARAVAQQVVSFRSWVAGSGVVWVDKLTPDYHDFLGKQLLQSGELIFSKNPALATRELSTIVNKSNSHATFRVTSDEYRNPLNKPDDFESLAIAKFKENKAAKSFETMEDGNYRYAQPVYIKQACLRCHGDPADAPQSVIEKYGNKRAFGYKLGDVRGIIGVTIPDVPIHEVISSFVNPVTLSFVVGAFLLGFLYTHWFIIRRLRDLTKKTHNIAQGDLDEDIDADSDSKDEIDQAAHAVNMLKVSLSVAMKHLS